METTSFATTQSEHQSVSDATELTLSWSAAYKELAATVAPLFIAFAVTGRLVSAERALTIGLIGLAAFGALVALVTPRRLVLTETELRMERALPILSRRIPWEAVLRFEPESRRWVRYALRPGSDDGRKAGHVKAWYASRSSKGVLSTDDLARLLNRHVITAVQHERTTVETATPAHVVGPQAPSHEPRRARGKQLSRRVRLVMTAAALAIGTVALLGDETTAEDGPVVAALGAVLGSALMMALVVCITWIVMRWRRSWSFGQTLTSSRVAIVTVLLLVPSFF
jgi:hypothetical protein